MATFSELMRRQRKAKAITLTALASEVGYHASHLSLVERGRRRIDEEGVVRIARSLGIDPTKDLLASLRDRLPEDLRDLVSTGEAPSSSSDNHAATRRLQASHFDYEMETLSFQGEVDWDGNLRMARTYEGCRPAANGKPVWEINFRDRFVGVKPSDSPPKFNVLQSPDNLDFELTTTVSGPWVRHRLSFPTGWKRSARRSDDTLSFSIERFQEKALSLDTSTVMKRAQSETLHNPLQGCLNFHLRSFTRQLRVAIAFPDGYEPRSWEAWAWWGPEPMEAVTRNVAGSGESRSIELRTDAGQAELVAIEPIAGYTYALVWDPANRHQYLESRFGDSP